MPFFLYLLQHLLFGLMQFEPQTASHTKGEALISMDFSEV
jgi:hypothetical protein